MRRRDRSWDGSRRGSIRYSGRAPPHCCRLRHKPKFTASWKYLVACTSCLRRSSPVEMAAFAWSALPRLLEARDAPAFARGLAAGFDRATDIADGLLRIAARNCTKRSLLHIVGAGPRLPVGVERG